VVLAIYRIFLWLYRTGALVLSPWNRKAALWLRGRQGLFQELESRLEGQKGPSIWMHCASLGEFEQGRPLLESLRNQYPDARILLSFFSPSGYEVRKDYTGVDEVFYLPDDSPGHASRWLDAIQPSLVLWVKYDYWYYHLREIRKRGIELLLVSGVFREDQPFFRWYGSLHREMLGFFSRLFVQNELSVQLLATIGYAGQVTLSGDTRFDRVAQIAEAFEPIPGIESFTLGDPLVVAGSTWEEDEEEMSHFANTHPRIKFILAPHETDEEHLQEMEKLFRRSIRYSAWVKNPVHAQEAANVLIIDNIGLLARLYRYARICFIGGGFGDDGVHNVLEAAVYGKPLVFGPVFEKYAEAVDLADAGAAFPVENALEFEKVLQKLLNGGEPYESAAAAARAYVQQNRGATEKILGYIQEKRLLTN
jgi:3-deoxy-D-manno-octulosonic-acid transferase